MYNLSIPNFKFLKKKIKSNSTRYPNLRKAVVAGNSKYKRYRNCNYKYANYWIDDNEAAQKELMLFYKEFYSKIKTPNHSSAVWIACSKGGVFVGFYADGWKAWYGGEGIVKPIETQVLKWWEYDEYKGVN